MINAMNFDFNIVYFPCFDSDMSHATSYWIYIAHPIRFARASSHVADFNPGIKI